MTNFEWIKNMTAEQMAILINRIGNFPCAYCNNTTEMDCGDGANAEHCIDGIFEWLESERKEND